MQNILMKTISFLTFFLLLTSTTQAQFYLKSEYITSSKFNDGEGNTLDGKADMKVVDGGLKIPVSVRMNENNRPTAWAVALGGTYASMHRKNLSKDYCLPEILNAQAGIIHMRPIHEKWSILAVAGAGIYTSDLDNITGKAILGQGGILLIKHQKPNFDRGVGVALNNASGYPMVFPSSYLDWQLNGKYDFKL